MKQSPKELRYYLISGGELAGEWDLGIVTAVKKVYCVEKGKLEKNCDFSIIS